MRTRRQVVLLATGLAALVTATILLAHRPEPSYQGHTLTYWLGECSSGPNVALSIFVLGSQEPAPDKQCVRAVRAIGTNAIPTLLAWISYEPSAPRRKLVTWLALLVGRSGRIPHWVVPEFGRTRMAALGFGILGERSISALSALAKIANGTNSEAAVMGVFAIGKAGPAAVPFLETVLANRSAIPRAEAARSLGSLGTNAIPALTNALADPDPAFAIAPL